MTENNTNSDIYELIGKKLNNEISEQEETVLNTLLEDKDNRAISDNLTTLWNTTPSDTFEVDTEAALSKINTRINSAEIKQEEASNKQLYAWMSIAASLLIVIGSYFIFNLSGSSLNDHQTVANAPQIKTITAIAQTVSLTDGSSIKLHKNSSLSYPETFESTSREVTLDGEAYFKIKKTENQPFIVHTEHVDIKVLGTSFYVKAVKGKSKVEVSVESGKVLLIGKSDVSSTLLLTTDEKGVFDNGSLTFNKSTINPNDLFWNTKILKFNRISLSDVALTINEHYNDSIIVDKALQNCPLPLTATFKNKSALEIAYIIAATHDLDIEENQDKILITGTSCN